MLEDYAEKNGFTGIRLFTDDGISGTTFEREGLQAMLAEVKRDNIGTIIVKDMSRLGRNYVQMGMLREQLRMVNVRLIAVNEGVDTGSGFDDDFLPFRDVINEYYAKDIILSIKVCALIGQSMTNGTKIAPKQWKAEIQSLQSEYDSISKEQTKTATELAYAEVISYNKKNLERELLNESRQHNRQQSRTKRREEEI